MAAGDITSYYNKRDVCLLFEETSTNGQPSTDEDGVALTPPKRDVLLSEESGAEFSRQPARDCAIVVMAAGSGGTVAVTLRLWGYHAAMGVWVPVGTGNDTTKGRLNAGAAIGETAANTVLHVEQLSLAGVFDRLYLEIENVTGTDTEVSAHLVTMRSLALQ